MRGLRIAFNYLRIEIMNEFQYRANLFIQVLQTFIALATGLIGLGLIFTQTSELGGWSKPELLAVMGIFVMMGGVIRAAIQPNMERLMEDIQEGTLDFALTKPADAQLFVSVREFRLWQLVDVVTGMIVIIVALVQLSLPVNIWTLLGFVTALIMGAVMLYCFWLIITSTAFWFVRINEIADLFTGLYAAGRWPVDIYPNWLRYGLTFLVPVAFAVTVPAEALTGRLTLQTWLGALALTMLLFALARTVWVIGLRNYSGASA
ncbi:MAG: ABC-2 family transporter protein [Anaerolineales bacterium]|uniref:ABC transporter permease n=1 Tax=Candidatus Villigracilis vicinus TaxID=3140679 RepID=UPI0031347E04|nr:ABC-2 family transporter protein [Anaerolineales bacterium]MBK9780731.1 ABC-2 family transporter protein [Anaerolineales bacterium]